MYRTVLFSQGSRILWFLKVFKSVMCLIPQYGRVSKSPGLSSRISSLSRIKNLPIKSIPSLPHTIAAAEVRTSWSNSQLLLVTPSPICSCAIHVLRSCGVFPRLPECDLTPPSLSASPTLYQHLLAKRSNARSLLVISSHPIFHHLFNTLHENFEIWNRVLFPSCFSAHSCIRNRSSKYLRVKMPLRPYRRGSRRVKATAGGVISVSFSVNSYQSFLPSCLSVFVAAFFKFICKSSTITPFSIPRFLILSNLLSDAKQSFPPSSTWLIRLAEWLQLLQQMLWKLARNVWLEVLQLPSAKPQRHPSTEWNSFFRSDKIFLKHSQQPDSTTKQA